jgi:predicted metalloenzyme YecM
VAERIVSRIVTGSHRTMSNHIEIRIEPYGSGYRVRRVPQSGIELTEASTIEGARHIARLITDAVRQKGWTATVIELPRKRS